MSYHPKPLYLQKPVFFTGSITEAEKVFLVSKWLPLHELAEGARLFHYTTLAGLIGILKERSLWLGHTSSFSDPTEMRYGSELVETLLKERSERESDKDIIEFLRSVVMWTTSFANHGIHHTFVTCFCESGNLLSQWRAYAHRGQGYCLGFEFSDNTLVTSDLGTLPTGRELHLRRVIYDMDTQKRLVSDYLDVMCAAVKPGLDSFPETEREKGSLLKVMGIQASNVLMDILICFKNPAFESEKEWRLVRAIREDIEPSVLKFRESNGELIPYRPTYIFEADKSKGTVFPIRSIGFGPMLDPYRTRSTLQLLLQNHASSGHPIALDPNLTIQSAGYTLRPSS